MTFFCGLKILSKLTSLHIDMQISKCHLLETHDEYKGNKTKHMQFVCQPEERNSYLTSTKIPRLHFQ